MISTRYLLVAPKGNSAPILAPFVLTPALAMRIPRRLVLRPFSYFHMMWRAHNREFILQDHREKIRYLRAVRDDYQKNCKPDQFALYGYAMMSNHAHTNGSVGQDHTPFSNHMRRAHSPVPTPHR